MIELTENEAESLRRHLDLSTRIANCGDSVEARRLAKEEDGSLSEGIEDLGRLTLTMIANVARYMVTKKHCPLHSEERRKLIEDFAALPDFQAMEKNFDQLKALLL